MTSDKPYEYFGFVTKTRFAYPYAGVNSFPRSCMERLLLQK